MKLYSRPGNDLTYRFPLIVEALAKLRSRSCIIDGEAQHFQYSRRFGACSAALSQRRTRWLGMGFIERSRR